MDADITQREFDIEEMPQGCVLHQMQGDDTYKTVVVRYPDDAIAVIESLHKMLEVQYPEYLDSEPKTKRDFRMVEFSVWETDWAEYIEDELSGLINSHDAYNKNKASIKVTIELHYDEQE